MGKSNKKNIWIFYTEDEGYLLFEKLGNSEDDRYLGKVIIDNDFLAPNEPREPKKECCKKLTKKLFVTYKLLGKLPIDMKYPLDDAT